MAELNLDVISINTAGLDDFTERRKIFNYLNKHVSREGIVFLQQTYSVRMNEKLWINQFNSLWGQVNNILTREIRCQKSANRF